MGFPYNSLGSLTVELISMGSPEIDLLEVGDEEETFALRYWRKLLKHIIIWKDN